MTAMFIVAADGSFVFEPVVIWRSKVPRCFRSLKDPSRPMSAHSFSNSKIWMNSDIMGTAFGRLDRKMNFENRKIIMFLDNATCHSESLQNGLANIKLVFLPKKHNISITTS